MADELTYSSDDLYGQYGYEGGQNVTFSALDAIISNIKVSSAQIENLAVTSAHIKEIDADIVTITNLTATNIKSLNGLNVGNGNFVIDANGNVNMKGDLSGSHGNFNQVRVSQEFGGDIRIGTGRLSADGLTWTATGDVALSSDTYDRAVLLGHIDGNSFDFNINGVVYASIVYSNGFKALTGTYGTAQATQYDTTRMTATVSHGLGATPKAVIITLLWEAGAVSLSYLGIAYVQDLTSSSFTVQITNMNGQSIPAGAWIDFYWEALPY